VAFARYKAADIMAPREGREYKWNLTPKWVPLYSDISVGALGDGTRHNAVAGQALLQLQLIPRKAATWEQQVPSLSLWAPNFNDSRKPAVDMIQTTQNIDTPDDVRTPCLKLHLYRAFDLPLDSNNYAPKSPTMKIRFLDDERVLPKQGGVSPEWYRTVAFSVKHRIPTDL